MFTARRSARFATLVTKRALLALAIVIGQSTLAARTGERLDRIKLFRDALIRFFGRVGKLAKEACGDGRIELDNRGLDQAVVCEISNQRHDVTHFFSARRMALYSRRITVASEVGFAERQCPMPASCSQTW